jgi:spore coat polysaccharide biosynthesis protein SpsF (cytidylyltransferase family)
MSLYQQIQFGRIVAIVQARMSSTRFPGKVMKPILGRPMLAMQLERLLRCNSIDDLLVATSDQVQDDPIAELCKFINITCFRGKLNDVLDRFYYCAQSAEADHVVRLTGDCPLTDPSTITALINFYLARDVDYASNCRPPTLPDGLDAEIFSFKALEVAFSEARDPYAREHVVPYIISESKQFEIANWSYKEDLSNLRWTVDEPEDFVFVTRVYEHLYPTKPDFNMDDVLGLLQSHPHLLELNNRFQRNQGSR